LAGGFFLNGSASMYSPVSYLGAVVGASVV
jgi:hypothetical protein